MKIYTKKGDAGKTSLIGGTRVYKFHDRIEAYGSVDELNSYVGLIADQDIDESYKKILIDIQNNLFTIGSLLAADPEKSKMKLPEIHEKDVAELETYMDDMNTSLPELKNFILPGGATVASFCHIARCVCRRAERHSVKILQDEESIITKYLNRLSDYLFVLARALTKEMGGNEVYWAPRSN